MFLPEEANLIQKYICSNRRAMTVEQIKYVLKRLSVLSVLGALLQCTLASSPMDSHVTLHRTTPNNQPIIAFDSLLSEQALDSLWMYALSHVWWEYGDGKEQMQCLSSEAGGEPSHCQDAATRKVPWSGQLDPEWFSQTHMWGRLTEAVQYAANDTTQDFYPYRIQSEMLQRGDNVAPSTMSSSQYQKEYALRLFLVPEWRMNDYGDMSFYTAASQSKTDGSEYDILLTVRPHLGRAILWDSSIPTLYRPPSMGYIQNLLSVTVYVTQSQQKFDAACSDWKMWDRRKEEDAQKTFPEMHHGAAEDIGLNHHLVRQFKDNSGRKGVVFDGLFAKEDLEALASYLIGDPGVGRLPYNLESYELSDNVPWLKTFDAFEFAESSVWTILQKALNHVGLETKTWHPYDVSLNVVRSADHTRVHEDCEEGEEEYTMVMYISPDLGPGDYGETIFFDSKPLDAYSAKLYEGSSKYDYDAITAVTPKYGRLVIFNGMMAHSARPPSTGYTGPRYTFTVKAAVNRSAALRKKLGEMLEDYEIALSQEVQIKEIREKGLAKDGDLWSDERLYQELKAVRDILKKKKHSKEQKLKGFI